jgi:hypothetical protein
VSVCYARAVQRSAPGFEASYRRHLAVEQRRAFLDALARNFESSATVGEIVDAAAALGWIEIGELSLADLADAILLATPKAAPAAAEEPADEGDDEADEEDDEEEDEEEEEVAAAPARGKKTAAKGKAAAKPAAPAKPAAAAKPAKPGKVAKVALDDRMSLDEAAAVLLPLVRAHGEATMQQLEQSTAGAGRRKLRFHIGQLVKNGRLERHGMGRGTFYTVA